MKLATRIVTGLAVLGLAAPVFAATPSTPSSAPAAQTKTVKHRHARKVAQSEPAKGEAKKAEKKSSKKPSAKKAEQGTKTEAPASAPKTEAPAAPAPAPAK